MNRHRPKAWAAALSLLVLTAAGHAAEPGSTQALVATQKEAHGLNPAQITAIRGISRNVLAAKKSGQEDSADAAQLASLRASLDALIATDLDPKNRLPITIQGQESSEQRKAREKFSSLRESARADARALAVQLRQHSELKASRAHSLPEDDTRTAGLPVGEQRAHLFERWAQKLDAALADGNEDRTDQLRELRDQLRGTKGGLSETPVSRGTPTLQAMPAGFVPPKNNDAAKE